MVEKKSAPEKFDNSRAKQIAMGQKPKKAAAEKVPVEDGDAPEA